MAESKLIVTSLEKSYPTPGEPLEILKGVSLEMSEGDSLSIVGQSGSGKSTFLQIIGVLDTPTNGKYQLSDVEPFQLSSEEQAKFRNEHIGFVFQSHHLLSQCSVLENVLIPAVAQGGATDELVARAEELIERVGLSERKTHRPAELSGGERQRTAIARALLLQPELILADEPTGNLDSKTADSIADLLFELQAEAGNMLIVVTHAEDLAARLQRKTRLIEGILEEY